LSGRGDIENLKGYIVSPKPLFWI